MRVCRTACTAVHDGRRTISVRVVGAQRRYCVFFRLGLCFYVVFFIPRTVTASEEWFLACFAVIVGYSLLNYFVDLMFD